MDRKGFSPRVVMICGAAGVSAWLMMRSVRSTDSAAIIGHTFCAAAYLMALLSCGRAASLYPKNSPIRFGWLAMAGNCVLSIARHTVLNPLFEPVAGTKERVYFLSQTLMLPGLVLVLVGMLSIWWGVYRLGLGFRVRWFDCAGIVAAAGMVTWIFRGHLSHAHSDDGTAILQALSLSLLIGIGGVGLLLHGLSLQMGGGRLAVVMRCVAVYALARSLLTLSQGDRESYSLLWWLCFYSVPWIFAFGAAYSCWLADTVRRSVGRTVLPSALAP